MSGEYEVDCDGCGQRHVASEERAREQRVVRCACGQFVRLDRTLTELRSEPPPALTSSEGDEDATHLLSSLAEVSALGGAGRGARGRASQASIHDDERSSSAVPRGTLRSLSPAPAKQPSTPPGTDKPLWYVDLGGRETVEMTIEQLIIARRSGKLGEGALVWREGMPRWRPVGTLIPATSIAAARPSAPSGSSWPPLPPPAPLPSRPASRTASPPPPPTRSATPSRPALASARSLASYERPLATLEFALEKQDESQSTAGSPSPLPHVSREPSRPPVRGLTPVPRPATWLASTSNPVATSRASVLPPSALPMAAALPQPSALPPPATPIATPLPSFTSDRTVEAARSNAGWDWLGDRPRWVSACIALVVCITASASGAILVRTLKLHRQPLILTPTAATGVNQTLPGATTPNHLSPIAPIAPIATGAAASAPLVVDLQSLSVEPSAPRRAARPAPKPAATTEASEPSVENTDPIDDEPSTSPQSPPQTGDQPSVPHASPAATSPSNDSSSTQ